MKINLSRILEGQRYRNQTLFDWVIWGTMVEHDQKHKGFLEEIAATRKQPEDNLYVDVRLIINGNEMPLHQSFKRLDEHMKEEIAKGALELVTEKFESLQKKADLVTQIIERAVGDAAKELGVKVPGDED